MKFVEFYESAVSLLDTYYRDLDAYLYKHRGWRLRRISGNTQDGLVSTGYYQIIDVTGNTLDKDAVIGKIKRIYHPKTHTLELDHISAGLNSTGRSRIRGLKLIDTVYSFDKHFINTYKINNVVITAVNPVAESKFLSTYTPPNFSINKRGTKIYAIKINNLG